MREVSGCTKEQNLTIGYLQNFKFYFLRFYLFNFREGREGEREVEKYQYVVASHMPPTGDLAHNPGMCPNWESKDPLVCRPVINPLSQTSQGKNFKF